MKLVLDKIFTLFVIILSVYLGGCGRAYFPVELKTVNRGERLKGQQDIDVVITSMTDDTIKKANVTPYVRKVIDARDNGRPAIVIPESKAINQKYPSLNDPGAYKLGRGYIRVLHFSEA